MSKQSTHRVCSNCKTPNPPSAKYCSCGADMALRVWYKKPALWFFYGGMLFGLFALAYLFFCAPTQSYRYKSYKGFRRLVGGTWQEGTSIDWGAVPEWVIILLLTGIAAFILGVCFGMLADARRTRHLRGLPRIYWTRGGGLGGNEFLAFDTDTAEEFDALVEEYMSTYTTSTSSKRIWDWLDQVISCGRGVRLRHGVRVIIRQKLPRCSEVVVVESEHANKQGWIANSWIQPGWEE